MSISRRVLSRHIATRLADGADRTQLFDQLAAYMVVHKMTGQLEMVASDIARNLAELGTVRAVVSSARPLTDELKLAVTAYVEKIEHARTVQIDELIDPDMIGGIIIETPRKRFDASVTMQLKRLRNV